MIHDVYNIFLKVGAGMNMQSKFNIYFFIEKSLLEIKVEFY